MPYDLEYIINKTKDNNKNKQQLKPLVLNNNNKDINELNDN